MEGCSDLACMPKGMGKLTNLHTLTQFVLGEGSSNKKQLIHDLEGLRALKKLKGCLKIKNQLAENEIKAMEDIRRGGGYLRSKEYLNHIDIRFTDRYEVNRRVGYDYEEVLLEDLQPHSNLMVLELSGYNGLNMPGWVAFLPNLVRIELIDCGTLQHLSCMRNLHNLKVLDLENLPNLEYIENSTTSRASTDLADSALACFSRAEGFSFFRSLERLRLYNLQKLKGWWRSETCLEARKLCLSQLKTLFVRRCPGLKSFPLCPRVENLNLWDFNQELRIFNSFDNLSSYLDAANSTYCVPKLSVVRVDNIGWLKSLPIDAFEHLSYMEINNDKEVENLEEVEELFRSCSSSLRCLCIEHCPKLSSLYAGLKHLTALETLYISRSPDISISDESEDNMNIWQQSLNHNLKSLQLRDLPKLVNLPTGMQYLTALRSLQISNCSGLKSLPSWMPNLTSLSRLDIQVCSTWLVERCQIPNGADWPKIHHIPSVVIL